MEMHEYYFKEVLELHDFIQKWLAGSVEKTREVFSRFHDVLSDDFQIIQPSGTTKNRVQVCDSLWSAYGTEDNLFSIKIRNLHPRISFEQYGIVTYEEGQYGQTTTSRISTALLRSSGQDGNLKWVHLHETWLPHK